MVYVRYSPGYISVEKAGLSSAKIVRKLSGLALDK